MGEGYSFRFIVALFFTEMQIAISQGEHKLIGKMKYSLCIDQQSNRSDNIIMSEIHNVYLFYNGGRGKISLLFMKLTGCKHLRLEF